MSDISIGRILTDRTTRFELEWGASIEVRMMDMELKVWKTRMDERTPLGPRAFVEVRLVVYLP